MTKFQTIIIIVFVVFIVGGLAAFATFKSNTVNLSDIKVSIWGTIPKTTFDEFVLDSNRGKQNSFQINYVEYQEPVFSQKLVEALARGAGPDIVLISEESLLHNKDKIYPITFKTYSERTFRDTFAQVGEVFLDQSGVLAVPFVIDPLVLYWNRDSFTTADITKVPTYWDEYLTLTPKFTKLDDNGNLIKSGLSFGEFGNVDNASSILSLLFMQAGAQMVTTNNTSGALSFSLSSVDVNKTPGPSALSFFTSFANPSKTFYSWNRSLPASQKMFATGDVASYVGFATEVDRIHTKNPNLNFDMAVIPQSRIGSPLTFAHVYGFALLKASSNISNAYAVISDLTSADREATMAGSSLYAPARRDLLAVTQEKAFPAILYRSAILARTWLNPNPQNVSLIYKNVVESITTGKSPIGAATGSITSQIQDEIDALARQ